MAAATLPIGTIFGTVATLHFDSVTLQASTITYDSTNGTANVSLDVVSGTQHQSLTSSPGLTATLIFSPAVQLVRKTVGTKTNVIAFPDGTTATMQAVPP